MQPPREVFSLLGQGGGLEQTSMTPRVCECGVRLPLRGSGQPVVAQCEARGRQYFFNDDAFRRADARLGDTSS